jgi:hypothetical protein
MDEQWLVGYLKHATQQQVKIELKKYREFVADKASYNMLRKIIVSGKKRRDAEKNRLKKGFLLCLDHIYSKIERGDI